MTAKIKSLLLLLWGIVLVDDATAQPFTFYFIEQQVERAVFGSFEWGDLDGDGDFDLVLTGNESVVTPVSSVFDVVANVEQGVLSDEAQTTRFVYESILDATSSPGLWLSAVAVADANSDGELDVFAAGATGGDDVWAPDARLLLNDGTGSFAPASTAVTPLYAGTATWLDVNNDAKMDLLTTGIGADDSFGAFLYENVDGELRQIETDLPGLANAAVAAADVDGDGDLDVAVNGRLQEGAFLSALYWNVDGRLVESGTALEGVAYGSLDWGDFDNDGDPDLLLTGGQLGPFVLAGVLRIYRNDDGVLTDSGIRMAGPVGGSARWGDYDADGLLDIVWTGALHLFARPAAGVFRNNGGRGFQERLALAGAFPSQSQWGDFDADGDLDLTIQGLGSGRLPLLIQYENDHRVVNDAPATPDGLTAEVTGSDVRLAWNAATDTETPDPGLTYNLRVGTEPGASDVVHPYAEADSGRRTRSVPGNVWHNRSWPLRGLGPGTYFWSVQAIDGAFQGSPFSAEGSFAIGGTGAGGDVSTDASAEHLPEKFVVHGNYPNPFRDETRIRFTTPVAQHVRVEVFDVLGSRVRALFEGQVSPGARELIWDGRMDSGDPAAAGIYVCRVRASTGWTGSGTMVLVR